MSQEPARIFLSSPDVTSAEERALVRAIRSGWVAPLGPEVDAFEMELAEYNERRYAVALSSGTAALHLGLLSLGVGAGDLVLTSSMTFAATANAIAYVGAEPVFIDSDHSGNMNPALLEHALADLTARRAQRVAAIVPVDLLGKVVDHDRIDQLAERYGVPVLSDAAESLGAFYRGRPSGSYGEAAAISFNGNKIMTTSGGGAILTDNADLAHYVRYLATQARQPVLHYEHTDIGYNYRLSNLLAALGRTQLSRLPDMIKRRRQIRSQYGDFFAQVCGVKLLGHPAAHETHDNCWLTSIVVDPREAGFTRDDLLADLSARGIEARPLWKPMHLQPVFASCTTFTTGVSEQLFKNGLSLPSGSALSDASLRRIFEALSVRTDRARAMV